MTAQAPLAKYGWSKVRLGDVCELRYGKSLPAGQRSGSGYPVYGSNGEVGRHDSALTSGATVIVGRKGSFGEVRYSADPCWPIDTTYYIDEGSTEADLRWLFHLLLVLPLKDLNRAAAIPGLNREDAYDLTVLLPPLDEQQRIAAVLDAAEGLRAKRSQALAKLDTLTESIFVNMFGGAEADEGVLSDHASTITKGTTPTSLGFDFTDAGVPFVRVQDLVGGTVPWRDIRLFVSEETSRQLGRSILRPADVLISIAGTIGRTAVVPDDAPELNCNQAVALVRTGDTLLPGYLRAWLCTRGAQDQMAGSRVTATISNLSLASVGRLKLPVPPVEQQREFVRRVDAVVAVGVRFTHSAAAVDALVASLQQRGFRGEL